VLVLAGVAAQTRVPETGHRGLAAGAPKTPSPPGWWRARGIVVAALGLATLGMVFSMYDVVWPQYLQARGAGTVLIGVSISLFALPMMLLATRGGRFADRANRRVILGCCFALTGACCVTYPLLRSIPVIITVGTVEALAVLMCEPSLYATVADSTPAGARGRAMGIGGFFQLAGSGVGAAVLGSAYGIREGLPFWAGGGGMIVTAGVCALAIPARRPGARSVADDAEAGGFVVGALEHGDHARGAQVDRPLFARKLDEVDVAAGDRDGGDGVGDLELDQDVGAVAET
jgi:DHA1 family multidrug resistance protein-like MFS transporter